MGTSRVVAAVTTLLSGVVADVYMQYPPGANNRLAEGGGNRNNNNRLCDTQNNAKGGYGYGGSNTNKADPVKYMAGSKLSLAWTSQHSCGSENAECQIVVQYMCSGTTNTAPEGVRPDTPGGAQPTGIGEGPVRDGTNGNSPDPNNPDASRGLHEPTSFYQDCDARSRNEGLYIADQNVNGDARRTRQNPNGARSGLECPEERDYYPYWHPTPWKDLAVMTNNLELCNFYRSESQNVKAKNYCTDPTKNNEAACTANGGGQWLSVPAFNIAAPECLAAPVQRDNHLGNGPGGNEVMLNVTIPSAAGPAGVDDAPNCVLRLRYNITTADTRVCSDSSLTTEEACVAGGGIWSAMYLDSTHNDKDLSDTPPLPDGNPKVQGYANAASTGGTDSLLELAINTNQYGRTFQDRSHVFSIQPRPANIPSNQEIINLNVKGKRGNIVQTYPATEYDFHPVDLVVGENDMVHIQWTGNDNTNNNGNNNGEGTNNEDRHNIVQLSNTGLDVPMAHLPAVNQPRMFDVTWEWNPEQAGVHAGPRDEAVLTKQAALSKQTNCLAAGDINGDQQRQNCEKLNAASATVDLGLMKFKAGTYKYMSSRNNNFSNRAQKAMLHVEAGAGATAPAVKSVTASALTATGANLGAIRVQWAQCGPNAVGRDTDLSVVYETDKCAEARQMEAFTVQRSLDGGETWQFATGCTSLPSSRTWCDDVTLPAGVTALYRVLSGNSAGWGEPSQTAAAQTIHSPASLELQQRLFQLASGEGDGGLDDGAVVAIVLCSLAGAFGLLFAAFMYYRRTPPPPPPPSLMKAPEPAYPSQPAYA